MMKQIGINKRRKGYQALKIMVVNLKHLMEQGKTNAVKTREKKTITVLGGFKIWALFLKHSSSNVFF